MELSAYELNRSLKGINNYTHINPEEYAEMSAPWGRKYLQENNNYHTEYYTSGYGNTSLTRFTTSA